MRVGNASDDLGCSRDWLRDLEKRKIIPPAPRDINGHRRYTPELMAEIRRIIYKGQMQTQGRQTS
jgi:DNA-binding transcriptional MerR regulator